MTASEEKYIRMTTAPVRGLICSFAVPSIICMLITSIYNMADTYFVSRLNTQSIASVGIVFSYMGIIQAIAFFFGHGSGNFISRALGARNTKDAGTMAVTGLFTAMICTTAIALVCFIFQDAVLRFFGSTATILPYARKYFRFVLVGTPFIAGSIVLNNQMRLQGNASMSMFGILVGGVLNIILDPLFIFVFDMGVSGAGLATAVSQMLCFILMLNLVGRNGGISINPAAFSPDLKNIKEIAAGGAPSLARQGLLFVSNVCLYNLASSYGDSAVAAFSVSARVMSLANAILIGFGQGFQPFTGFNFGAGKYARLRSGLRFTLTVMTVYCCAVSIMGVSFAPKIVSLFNGEDAEVLAIGAEVLRFMCLSFPLCGLIVLTNMFLQTTRKTVPAVLVAAARQGLFFIPVVFIAEALLGIDGIAMSQAISDVSAFAFALPFLVYNYRQLKESAS